MNTGTNPSSRTLTLCAGTVFIAALILYAWTLAPTVTLTDSGELIVVAYGLGIAHPPGVPLWVLLAHLASLVPLGNIAARINFSSALFAALASAMLTLVVAELMITASYLAASKRKKKGAQRSKKAASRTRGEDSGVSRLLVLAPAIGAGLLMAFSRTLWSYATITEVYALNTFLILVIFFLMLRWRRCIIADRKSIGIASDAGQIIPHRRINAHDSFLYAAALVFGLALGVRGPEVLHEPPPDICCADFDWGSGRCLYLLAACGVALACHQLGQSTFAAGNMVACHRPAVSGVLLLYTEDNGRAVC